MIHVKRYRIRPVDLQVRQAMLETRGEAFVDVAANDMASAWRKFVTQRFGALKPDPAQWDISLVRP